MSEQRRPARAESIGRVMIVAGAAVWLVYGVVWLLGGDPQVGHYLPAHLSGVVPGAVLSRWRTISGWFRRRG